MKYKISIKIGTETFSGEGETPLEALRSVPAPRKITNKGIMKMTYGDKKTERMYMPIKLRRYFFRTAQPILAKQLLVGLK